MQKQGDAEMPAIWTKLVVAPCWLHRDIQVKTPQVICAFKHMPTFKQVLEHHCRSLNFKGTLGHCSRINPFLCSLNTWDGLAHGFFALLDQGLQRYKLISILVGLNISSTYTKISLIFCQYSTSLVSWHPGHKPLIFPMIWLTNSVLEGTSS